MRLSLPAKVPSPTITDHFPTAPQMKLVVPSVHRRALVFKLVELCLLAAVAVVLVSDVPVCVRREWRSPRECVAVSLQGGVSATTARHALALPPPQHNTTNTERFTHPAWTKWTMRTEVVLSLALLVVQTGWIAARGVCPTTLGMQYALLAACLVQLSSAHLFRTDWTAVWKAPYGDKPLVAHVGFPLRISMVEWYVRLLSAVHSLAFLDSFLFLYRTHWMNR